ncbi:MAG: hypothetical protein AAF320_04635 [Myxococcota bacterium]
MAFSPKQLENLEQLSDSRDELGPGGAEEQVGVDKDPVDPLVWRLKLIERAAVRVKKLHNAKLDTQVPYQIGELVFDDKAKRFARVQNVCLKSLSLHFLSGGQEDYKVFQKPRGGKTLPSVVHPLPSVSGQSVQKLPSRIAAATITKGKPVQKASSRGQRAKGGLQCKTRQRRGGKQLGCDLVNETGASAAVLKQPRVKNRKLSLNRDKKIAVAERIAANQEAPMTLSSVKQRDDYIRAHYLKMGNKELARHTGLSEHTIRRKLGEWSLRRPTA